jgi:hypothetical protein
MMKLAVSLLLGAVALSAHAQSIEGFWQDTERRILFSADAPPGFEYGRWTALDANQTYPSAKQIRKVSTGVEVVDFLYDDEEVLTVARADDKTIEFTRASTWSNCSVLHRCALEAPDRMLCSLETSCSRDVVWRGEERYARRATCERVEVRRAQGVPHRCR